jgi:CHAT domain-containing protein/tetratricopeptide (TPR) repeat protein
MVFAVAGLSPHANAQEIGWLGAGLKSLSEEERAALPTGVSHALKITRIVEASPAQRAGLAVDDVIVRFDDWGEDRADCFVERIKLKGAGAAIQIEILRTGNKQVVDVVLGRAGDGASPATAPQEQNQQPNAEFRRAADFARQCVDPDTRLGAAKRALPLADSVTDWRDDNERKLEIGRLWVIIGGAYFFRKDWIKSTDVQRAEDVESAVSAYRNALDYLDRGLWPRLWASAQRGLGKALVVNSNTSSTVTNIENAISAFESALTVSTKADDPKFWATISEDLGDAYKNRFSGERVDNIELSIAAYQRALEVITVSGDPRAWARITHNLALAYDKRLTGGRRLNLQRALALLDAAEPVFHKTLTARSWANLKRNRAAIRRRLADGDPTMMAAVVKELEECLAVFTKDRYPQEWAATQYNISVNLIHWRGPGRAERQEQAIERLQAALTVWTRNTYPKRWSGALNNLGAYYHDRINGDKNENLQKAIAALETALSERGVASDPERLQKTSLSLGLVHASEKKWELAEKYLADARRVLRLRFAENHDLEELRQIAGQASATFSLSAFVAAELGRKELAVKFAEDARARGIDALLRLQAVGLSKEARARVQELRLEISRIADALDGLQGTSRGEALQTLAGHRRELAALVPYSDEAGGESGQAREIVDKILRTKALVLMPVVTGLGGKLIVLGAPRERVGIFDWPELATERVWQVLPDVWDRSNPAGWFANYNKNYVMAELAARMAEVGRMNAQSPEYKALSAQYADLDRRWREAIENLGPQLWGLLGRRLQEVLTSVGAPSGSPFVWLPSNGLGMLPLGLAADPASGRFLSQLHDISYAPSLASLIEAERRLAAPIKRSLAGVVNPTGDLAYTEVEAALVARHFQKNDRALLYRNAAGPDQVVKALSNKSYWHFASHGTFDWEDAQKSGLLLPDGRRLTVNALSQSVGLGRPRLVVLSACETGLYDIGHTPEEFIGLPGAFISLGAVGVLSTLWQVDDRATTLLIAKFYDLHIREGHAPAVALSRAQDWLRSATEETLLRFVRAASKRGDVSATQVSLIENSFRRSADQVRFGYAVPGPDGHSYSRDNRPFAHPFYWGAFVHTGL